MVVTNIEEICRGRYRIYIDGDAAFVLYNGEIRKYSLTTGKDISQETYALLMDEILPKRAKLRLMNLLTKKSYTENQLRTKLIQGEYPADIIEEALDYVKSFHYVDDSSFVRDYIFSHRDDKSISRMRMDILNKGIGRDVFDTVLNEIMDSEDAVDENEQIFNLLKKKHFDPEKSSFEEKQKICAFLMRKGYSFEAIMKSIAGFDEMN